MNISYNWLKQYVNLSKTADEVAEKLTSIGLEVDSVEVTESIKGGLKGLVVGEVLTCEAHPNSDHLHVTTVNVGQAEPLAIVCGAPNVAAGQKVIVATVGTVLYDGDKEFVIKPSKLRGEPSYGMICAEDEIGVGNDHSGIIVLPDSAVAGTPAAEYYGIENDTMIVVDITPNRADAASHFGVARDLAVAYSLEDNTIQLQRPSVDNFKVSNNDKNVKVFVENSEACGRYSGVTISGVTIKESPEWLQKALKSIGLTPINNVVDVTNYILFAFGQPLHAFDLSDIKGNEIHVRTGLEGKKFITLDGKEHTLHADDLMICNTTEPMCIAGVFGGLNSGVKETTTDIFLESAWFNSVSIRKTARRHQLSTDASFRYERGTDPNNVIYALKRAAILITEVAGGVVSSDIFDSNPTPAEHFAVTFSRKRCFSLIGKEISEDTLQKILKGLEIDIVSDNGDVMELRIPPYRVDVTREADVIEDILRIYGYNNVETPTQVHSTLVYADKPERHTIEAAAAAQLSAQGFHEIMCNTLTHASYFEDKQNTYDSAKTIILANPLSADLNALRQSLLFGALESAQHNSNRKNQDLKLFEFGAVHHLATSSANRGEQKSYIEEWHMSMLMTGMKAQPNWITQAIPTSFFDLKSALISLLERLGFDMRPCFENPIEESDIFAEGISITDTQKKVVAQYGKLNSALSAKFDIDKPVYYAEINMDIVYRNIRQRTQKNPIRFSDIPKFPEVKRDLALLIDKSISYAQVRNIALKTEKRLLKSVNLFDVYEGKNLPEGKKSYAVSFILQDEEKTLNDKQIDGIMQQLISAFQRELGAELR
ncbi:MAG: phenylalanine--tRNA ligase subunit beta [Marinilabiliaceae bacterium]|nr:phenylalanine--tRNA ligase subunit beta [Marinilabiliaceae bacterium]